jgi:hypothetical protein
VRERWWLRRHEYARLERVVGRRGCVGKEGETSAQLCVPLRQCSSGVAVPVRMTSDTSFLTDPVGCTAPICVGGRVG